MPDLSEDLEAFAAVSAAVALAGLERDAALRAHGLDEASWQALEDAWQARFDAEPDDEVDLDLDDARLESADLEAHAGPPALLTRFAEAFARAQRALSSRDVSSFDDFLEVTRAIRRGDDLRALLERKGLTLADFLRAQREHTARMLEDDELAERFRRAIR